LSSIVKSLGPFPKAHVEHDVWTTSALIDVLWKEGVPPFSMLWLGEPDLTQHETAPGAPEAVRAIRQSDANLRRILEALEHLKARQSTDLFLVADQRFSTLESVGAL